MKEHVSTQGKETRNVKDVVAQLRTENEDHFAITIAKARDEIYNFLRDFNNLPGFIQGLQEIDVPSATHSHWVMNLKGGIPLEWDCDIVDESVNEMIRWKSSESSFVETSGSIWFSDAPAGKGCVVSVAMDLRLPGGKVSELAATFVGDAFSVLIPGTLRRMKALIETGDIPTIEGQSSGRSEDLEENIKH